MSCIHCGATTKHMFKERCGDCIVAVWLINGQTNRGKPFTLDDLSRSGWKSRREAVMDRAGLIIGLADPTDHRPTRVYLLCKQRGVSDEALSTLVECFNSGFTVEAIKAVVEAAL